MLQDLLGDFTPEQLMSALGETTPESNRRRMISNFQKICTGQYIMLSYNVETDIFKGYNWVQKEEVLDTRSALVSIIAPEFESLLINSEDPTINAAIDGVLEIIRQNIQSQGIEGFVFDYNQSLKSELCFFSSFDKNKQPIWQDVNDLLKMEKVKNWLISELTGGKD